MIIIMTHTIVFIFVCVWIINFFSKKMHKKYFLPTAKLEDLNAIQSPTFLYLFIKKQYLETKTFLVSIYFCGRQTKKSQEKIITDFFVCSSILAYYECGKNTFCFRYTCFQVK